MAEYIDREALIQELDAKLCTLHGELDENRIVYDAFTDGFEECVGEVGKFQFAADVAPVGHWVLTDEKLPPDGQDVLCWYEYFRYGAFNRMYQTYGIGFQFNGNWGGEVANGRSAKVLAWMLLPEPPEEK